MTPILRLKNDKLILKLGIEECELIVKDGMTNDTAQFLRTLHSRIQEILAKRRRKVINE